MDDPRLALGTEPIPGADPAGENARYDPSYDALTEEVGKMETGGPTAVDWPKVAEMSGALLRDKTKDILVASYLAYALQRTEGVPGLAVGLGVLANLVETYWETGFPPLKRERARVGAVEWLAERVGPALTDLQVDEGNAAQIMAAFEAVDRLDRALDEKTTKSQANLSEMLRPLRERNRDAEFVESERAAREAAAAAPLPEPAPTAPSETAAVAETPTAGEAPAVSDASPPPSPASSAPPPPEPAAAPAPVTAPPAPATATPASAGGPAPAVEAAPDLAGVSGPEFERAVREFRSGALKFARGLRAANASDARSYALQRVVSWLAVHNSPPAANGATQLPEPPADDVSRLKSLADAGNHEAMIGACEEMTATHLFWLDPHRHLSTALAALGHQDARAAVDTQVAAFVSRFPDVVTLSFQSGKPFADETTRFWVDEISPSKAGGDAGVGEGSPANDALAEARNLVLGGKPGEAAALFTEGRRSAEGGRARLLWDLAKTRFCLDAGYGPAAASLALSMDEAVKAHDLEAWEPRLCEEITLTALRALSAPSASDEGPSEEDRTRLMDLTIRLYRLNMSSALEIMRSDA